MLRKAKEYITIARDTGFFYIMLSNILNSFFSFVSGIILVRMISKGEYGIYSYANNILLYFLLFSGLGMASGTFQVCCENNKDKAKMYSAFRFGVSRGIMINIILGVGIILYSRIVEVSIQGSEDYLLLMAFLPAVNIISEFASIYFRSDYRNKEYGITLTVNVAVVSFVSVLAAYRLGASGIILARYLGPIFGVLFACYFTDLKKRWNASALESKLKREIWRISLVTMVTNAIAQLMYLIDISMLGTYIKEEKVIASYQIAVTIPTAMNLLPSAIITYIYPYFAAHIDDIAWTKRMVKKLLSGTSILFGMIALVMFLLADFLVPTVFGAQYTDAVPVFRILCVSFFFQATFRMIFGNLLVSQRKLTFNLVVSILSGVVNIVGDYVLIRRFEAVGVAVTTLIVMAFSGMLSVIYYFIALRKKERMERL